MTKSFVKSLLPQDMSDLDSVVEKILSAHGAGIEREKGKAADIQKKLDAALEAKKEAEEAMQAALNDEDGEKELAKLKEELETAKTEKTAAEKALADYKENVETKEVNANIDKQVLAAVKAAKLHDSVLPLFEKIGYDRNLAKVDKKDGKVTNLDEVVTAIKALPEFAPHFGGESRTEGAGAGNPPPGKTEGGGQPETLLEALKDKYEGAKT